VSRWNHLAGPLPQFLWDVTNRRLLAPLTGSTERDGFPATAVCRSTLFDGAASLDEISFPTRGFSGLTLRLFDPAQDGTQTSLPFSVPWPTTSMRG